MSSAINILQRDVQYLDQRRKEMQEYLDVFAHQLYAIVSMMPAPAMVIYESGETKFVQDEKWEQLINKLKEQQQSLLMSSFPEFFNEEK